MKRILSGFIAMIAVAAIFTACTKTTTQTTSGNDAISQTFQVNSSQWTNTSDEGVQVSLPFNEITWDIVDKGLVVAYLSFDGGETFDILPVDMGGVKYSFTHTNQNITIYGYNLDGTQAARPGNLILKVVSIAARSLTMANSVNMSDYQAVKSAFNLKD